MAIFGTVYFSGTSHQYSARRTVKERSALDLFLEAITFIALELPIYVGIVRLEEAKGVLAKDERPDAIVEGRRHEGRAEECAEVLE